MSFIQTLTEILESIFKAGSPEVKKRQEIRRIESELRNRQPSIYKNEMLQPNFAELFRILYENTKPVEEILRTTACSDDLQQNGRYEYQLILTGFPDETQKKLEQLSYESRKRLVEESGDDIAKTFEMQRRSFGELLKSVHSVEFRKIDETLSKVMQLSDICRFNYMNIIHAFDPNFDGISSQTLGNVKLVKPSSIGSYLQDFYYLTSNFSLNSSVARAVIALRKVRHGNSISESEKASLMENLQKINTVLTTLLDSETLRKIICLAYNDPAHKPKTASYTSNAVKRFLEFVQGRYDSDEQRIKTEIKDYTISFELKELFGEIPLLSLKYYDSETNDLLRKNTPYSLAWITPLQTMKTFLSTYYTEEVRTILSNIELEGFFNDAALKSNYAASISACAETAGRIEAFENSFERGQPNDIANVNGLVEDSRRDADFLKKLGPLVDNINNQAHKIIQEESKNFYSLYRQISEIILDSKKSKPAMISNIKVLVTSPRNRDGAGLLEQQHGAWKSFLKIMKNYAIIGELDDGNE